MVTQNSCGEKRHVIVNGPDRLDLLKSLFGRRHGGVDRTESVVFSLNAPIFGQHFSNASVRITGLNQDDGLGDHGWNFEGFAFRGGMQPFPKVRGWFSTETKEGWLEVID
jgi:hypothetical protein